jgi:hypothetical protein
MLMCILSINGLSLIVETVCLLFHVLDPLRLAIVHLIFFVLFFAESIMLFVQIGITVQHHYIAIDIVKSEGFGIGITTIIFTVLFT